MTEHPRLPGRLGRAGEYSNVPHEWPVAQSNEVYRSAYIGLSIDTVVAPDGGHHDRAVVQPHGAVGVIALDESGRLLLVEQYRHPVRKRLLEIPAGTLDVEGEAPAEAAARELAEEADITADSWSHVLRMHATPGYSTEAWDVFLATELTAIPAADREERLAEEADMTHWWVDLDDAIDAITSGHITDAMTVASILAVARTRP